MNGSGRNVAGCANCQGNCCRRYKVTITAGDIRRLHSGLGLAPSDFVRLLPEDDEGFQLKPGGPTHGTYLVRRPESGACQFLMEIAPGKARCGVYAHRPLVCSNFPMQLNRTSVAVRQNTVCGPDMWNIAAMEVTGYRRDLVRDREAWREHRRLMREWNTMVETAGHMMGPSSLYEYLLAGEPTS